jgi:hypothetical protein
MQSPNQLDLLNRHDLCARNSLTASEMPNSQKRDGRAFNAVDSEMRKPDAEADERAMA